ncbi:MAG TPA: ABC transporter permease [Parafilimonas sp.]|nr:ABC transporter permease [Parafilimonas sp.]
MFKNYFTIAFRNLLKNKIFSMVNILGLAIGMAACFFIYLYVRFESSYDRFNKNAANLYRVTISYSGSFASSSPPMATNHPAVGPAMKADFPEVVDFARIVPASYLHTITITYTDVKGNATSFNEDKMCLADPSFLTLFTFPFIKGNPAKALAEANTIVISNSTAKKYFGKADPMGKTLYLNKQFPFKVTGVFADVPENSHIKFDMLGSVKTWGDKWNYDGWTDPEFYNYVLLTPGTDPQKVEAKFPAFINKYLGTIMKQLNFGCAFHLQPVTDIHLKSQLLLEPEVNGSERDIYFLSIIGLLILIVAWINYINLSTAKSIERAKEVGLRKVVGASRLQLIGQFIIESGIVNLLAMLLAAFIIFIFFPYFSGFIGKNISEEFLSAGLLHQPKFWLIIIALFVTSAFLVGAYPAFVLSHYRPVSVLKGKFFQSAKGIFLRKSLVSFQFLLSVLLIAGTIIVYKQLLFMRNHTLGYNKDQVVVVKAPTAIDSTFMIKVDAFQTELLRNSSISSVAASSDIPGKEISEGNTVRRASEDKTHNYITNILTANENFISTYQMNIAAGRNFLPKDTANFVAGGLKQCKGNGK